VSDTSTSMLQVKASVGRQADRTLIQMYDVRMRCEQDNQFACNTPASEVEAQLFNGGIEGSYPTLLKFHYKKVVEVDTWEGISGYHDFE
jgi:hypothetical protein